MTKQRNKIEVMRGRAKKEGRRFEMERVKKI